MPARRDEADSDVAETDKAQNDEATGFFQPILGDGRPLLLLTAGSLFFVGGFAIFLAVPLSRHERCRPLPDQVMQGGDFMVHDRSSFGGVMCGVAVL